MTFQYHYQIWTASGTNATQSVSHRQTEYVCVCNAALVRAFGPDMAEVPLLATRHELQGNALGPALLHSIEAALLQAGVKAVIMPALPLSEGLSPEAPSAPGQSAVGPKPWGTLVGYKVALPAQLLHACQMPMVQLPGTCYLIKQLSLESLTKVSQVAIACISGVKGWGGERGLSCGYHAGTPIRFGGGWKGG